MRDIIDQLAETRTLPDEKLHTLITAHAPYLYEKARAATEKIYGDQIFVRGLIEITSYCKNNCYYCGIRCENQKAERYRLQKAEILDCCKAGYAQGFRTFVLQGGEDPYYTDERLAAIVCEMRRTYPACAITLSMGERSTESYETLRKAGADRYLLRHETANNSHYKSLHPPQMSLENRKKCLYDLKKIGYQTGCGFMVGSPGQNLQHIVEDLRFIQKMDPAMVGVGPFLPHSETPFSKEKAGDLRQSLNILAILRLMQPKLLLPATTALETLDPQGRVFGILAGANVVMLNLSPMDVRKKYLLYDNKANTGDETAKSLEILKTQLNQIGRRISNTRGDHIDL